MLLGLCPLTALAAGRSLVLEDFETAAAARKWEGPLRISEEHASHGADSAEVRFDRSTREVTSSHLARDWRGYDRLAFDLYSDRPGVSTGTIRIYDAVGGDAGKTQRDDYYDAREKIFVQKGWNHVEVKLTPLRAATYLRDLSLDRIVRVAIAPARVPCPGRCIWTTSAWFPVGRRRKRRPGQSRRTRSPSSITGGSQ